MAEKRKTRTSALGFKAHFKKRIWFRSIALYTRCPYFKNMLLSVASLLSSAS